MNFASIMEVCFPNSNISSIDIRWVCWHPTRKDCFVLNMDGSCFNDGRAGASGLIRRGDGSWVIGFNDFLGIANNNYVELMHGIVSWFKAC
jgi:hypothetical protein